MATSGSKSVAVTSWDTLKFSWSESSQSISNNTTTISWKLQLIATSSGRIDSSTSKAWSVTVNGTKYSGSVSVGIANNATKTLASGTTTITHNSDGTKTFSYSFSQSFSGITFSGKALGTVSGSGTGTLDTIPRKSTLTASNGTLGTAQTLTINKADSSFKHKITFKCGSTTDYIAGGSSTFTTESSVSWTPWLSLASNNTTGTSVSITLYLYTYTSGGTQIGYVTKTISCAIPASVKPSCSVAVSDPTGYADKYGAYIKGMSKFKVVVTPTTAHGSAIASYNTTANGSKYTAASFTTDVLKTSGSLTVSATVKDKRGRTSAAASVTKTVLDYKAPEITINSVERCDADGKRNNSGSYLAVNFNCEITPLNNKNTAAYSIQYKKTSDENYSPAEPLTDYANQYSVSGGVFVFPAAPSSTYDIVLTAADAFGSYPKATVGKSVFKLWSIFRKYLGIAFGKYAELEGVFDIGFQTRFYGGILHPVLEPNTDLNDILTPNTYIGANLSSHNYTCGGEALPLSTGTFSLEVVGMGEEGQVKQRLTYCHKTASRAWERIYYGEAWGEWICVTDFDGQLLWSGTYFMHGSQTITLTENTTKQKTGIVLVFSEYIDGEAVNQSFHSFFVDKKTIYSHSGQGHVFHLSTSNLAYFATKYLYISNSQIVGHDNNDDVITGACGITATNNRFVLRYVIGV